MEKEFWKCDGERSRCGYITDEHRNIISDGKMQNTSIHKNQQGIKSI